MQTGVGYGLICELPQPTPMLLAVHIHHSRAADLRHGNRQSHGKTILRPAHWASAIVGPAVA